MWRLCDLHVHTQPNEQCSDAWDAAAWVTEALDMGLDVVAITDHDHGDHVAEAVAAAEGKPLEVVPGVELSTDRGHVLVLAPGTEESVLSEFIARVGARRDHQVPFDDVMAVVGAHRSNGEPFSHHVITVGSHVDMEGSLLGANNPLSREGQIQLASRLHALEVCREEVLEQWLRTGVKQSGKNFTLLQGSDSHILGERRSRGTWLYLSEITVAEFRHAFALPESAVRFQDPPAPPSWCIESIEFSGGHHDGLRFEFCERSNALIGPPNSGKSLVVDALKFAFGVVCDLPEVESVSKARTKKCLPSGTSIEVRVRTPEGQRVISRTLGGRASAQPPFRPIIFSQTELTRRGMAASPAIALLDLHVPNIEGLKADIVDRASALEDEFLKLAGTARSASDLREVVTNPQDGLEATKAELGRVVGTEEVARRATDAVRVSQWRDKTRKSVDEWAPRTAENAPKLPAAPRLADKHELLRFLPSSELGVIGQRFHEAVTSAVITARDQMIAELDRDEPDFVKLQEQLHAELKSAGFEGGSEVTAHIESLRNRLGELEDTQNQLHDIEAELDAGLVRLRDLLRETEQARQALTMARKDACRAVNNSMRTFFARIDEVGITARLDNLIDELKTGTYMRPETRRRTRDDLDRLRLLEHGVRHIQGVAGSADDSASDQSRIVEEAIGRGRDQDIAQLACLWPGDGLSLERKGSPPTPFSELTEGLRALAIKEISFAASYLPVVSDQPEDAVPTRSVFDSLVPTLREQRTDRQFIVVSHDANIVVASDVERVCALEAHEDGSPHTGTLFDPLIRDAALEHLEGGQVAFQLRAARYEQLHETVNSP